MQFPDFSRTFQYFFLSMVSHEHVFHDYFFACKVLCNFKIQKLKGRRSSFRLQSMWQQKKVINFFCRMQEFQDSEVKFPDFAELEK